MLHPLLDINIVDFDDPLDIGGFVSLLCQIGGSLGMAVPGFRPTADSNEIRRLANVVARKLECKLPQMSSSSAFVSVSLYDFAHRLAYMVGAERAVLNKYVLKAFDALIHGDSSVDEYAMFREIKRGISRRDPVFMTKPLSWNCICEERWKKEACRGNGFTGLADYDILNRLSILMESDSGLGNASSQTAFKRSLFEQYRHYLDSHATNDSGILNAVGQFFRASCKFLTAEEFTRYRMQLDLERVNSPATNRFMRASLQLSLQSAAV